MLIREIWRILKRPAAAGCIIIYAFVLLLGINSEITNPLGAFYGFWMSENYGVAILILPLVFPIAAAGNYFDEKKTHCEWIMQMRSGQLRYCISKIIAAAAAGILLYLLSVGLFFVLLLLLCPGFVGRCTAEEIGNVMGKENSWYELALRFG